jgi:hypothetical protein
MAMKVTRVGVTPEGGSMFDESEIELSDKGEIGWLSDPIAARSVIFRRNDPGYDYDWHCAPPRQLIVMLDGAIEIEVTNGDKREFRAGDVILVEDTTGTGHRSRSIQDGPRHSLFIPLQ